MAKGPVKIARPPIQRDGLIHQVIVRGPLHLDRQMVPGTVVGMAGNARRSPALVLVVPNVPFVSARDAAFVAPDETHTTEELIDVKLQGLREPEVISIEIDVVSEVVECRNQRLIGVRHALRRGGTDQRVVPQGIGVRSTASNPKYSGLPADRRRPNPLSHGEGNPIAG